MVIVTGFLGAGKTTFLRELLPLLSDCARRPYVILNDFLNAEIDSATLKGVVDEVHAISAGCVCCESSDALNRTLHAIRNEPPPIVFIEANGTTDPYPLIELVTLLPRHFQRFGPVLQVNIINEKRWQKRLLPWDRSLERAQAATASHILTNRSSAASLKQQLRLRTDLSKINPHAERVLSIPDFAKVIRALSQSAIPQPELNLSAPIGHAHHHVATRIELPALREEDLIRWLVSFPAHILRIKGAVRLINSEHEACFFQRTDDELERPTILKGKMPETTLPCAVFIGIKLDSQAIQQSLKELLAAPPPSAGEVNFTPTRLPALLSHHKQKISE
ncbi:GTP-binding protein [Luteolibacter pohnpeiensis]|uniref:GTP-binding protein n=1 Tax=Luteolibacter pohnpeiensis TaxID=454153 RepID=A0A934VS05_9BACT|nr:GTP-binding protein [Luteolibacter pohnpeiensis]